MIIALVMEAVRTSETSVYSETTRRYSPKDSDLYNRRHVNLKFLSRNHIPYHKTLCSL
jgi:hypothetical protein